MKTPTNKTLSIDNVTKKLEFYCAYQERCHDEVTEKMRSYAMTPQEIDSIIVHLIEHNFLNEDKKFDWGENNYTA